MCDFGVSLVLSCFITDDLCSQIPATIAQGIDSPGQRRGLNECILPLRPANSTMRYGRRNK